MEYRLQKNGKPRSERYRGTVTDLKDPALVGLRENVTLTNKNIRKLYRETGFSFSHLKRVRVMGRGPRAVHAKKEGFKARFYDCYLPQRMATYWDVYVTDDYDAEYNLRK